MVVENQVFAQVTSVYNFTTCEAEEGVLGLAYSMKTTFDYASLLGNLNNVASSSSSKRHAMFAMYLSSKDDYPAERSPFQDFDDFGNMEYGFQRPTSAYSEIVFGGVNQTHYEGCLQWHSLGHFEDVQTGSLLEGYWDFALDSVRLGGTLLSSSTGTNLAVVDSGSSYIIGPPDSIAQIASQNHASCFNMIRSEEPQLVDCALSSFDAAVIDCDQPFFNLEFIANGHTYVLEKEDLMIQVETNLGPACILRLVGSKGISVSMSE